jgi:hypothetical protein
MSNNENMNGRDQVTWGCYPFLFLGSSAKQFAFGLFGLIIICAVFRSHPDAGFSWTGMRSLVPVAVVAIGLLVGGVIETRNEIKILNGGETVSASLCKIMEDREPEDIEYNLFFEYTDVDGRNIRFQAVRDVNNLAIGQSFPFLINRELGIGLLEPNLPGGITFANVYGRLPIPIKCWIRILFIPLLTAIPLLGLIGSVSVFVQQATSVIGLPILYWWTIIMQLIWYYAYRRYFSPGKPVRINYDPACPLERLS